MLRKLHRLFNMKRTKVLSNIILPYLSPGENVLDFGCGNMMIAEELQKKAEVCIRCADVSDRNLTDMELTLYDGKKLPFSDSQFDCTYLCFVLHHCRDAMHAVSECARVTRDRIIIIEDIYRSEAERKMMAMTDHLFNLVSDYCTGEIHFRNSDGWLRLFRRAGFKDIFYRRFRLYSWKPGSQALFVLRK